jgi:hypothetical protein
VLSDSLCSPQTLDVGAPAGLFHFFFLEGFGLFLLETIAQDL